MKWKLYQNKGENNMSKQAENFKNLVKGNSISSITMALSMVQSSVRDELMKEFKVSTTEELAFKLKQYGKQLY